MKFLRCGKIEKLSNGEEEISINRIIIDKGRVTSIEFECAEKKYVAFISQSKVCNIQKEQKKEIEGLPHVCGASGFGLGIDDYCIGCDREIRASLEEKRREYNSLSLDIITAINYINKECNRLENLLREHDFK